MVINQPDTRQLRVCPVPDGKKVSDRLPDSYPTPCRSQAKVSGGIATPYPTPLPRSSRKNRKLSGVGCKA